MAKGNMLLGYSRGSVGDVTFYRSGGSQRSRARNRNPNNPKTEKQQTQRSRFANAVKFYKQATTNFFRFAYEDKKVNESDYNAFMRHNTLRSGFIGAAASKIANFPALGYWQLTDGSLPEISSLPQVLDDAISFDLGVEFDAETTVGQVSQLLINSGDLWRVGDILTVVVYTATNLSSLPTVDTSVETTASVGYKQIILDTTSTMTLTEAFSMNLEGVTFRVSVDSDGFHVTSSNTTTLRTMLFGAAVIHSRNTSNGLLVSRSELSYYSTSETVVDNAIAESGNYYQSVLADWDAAANAVLQGSVSSN